MNTIDSINSQALLQAKMQKTPEINKNSDDAKLREQTDAFEALLVKTLLDTAMKMDDGLFPKSPGHDIYASMYKEQLSQSLSGNFGYSDALFNWLKEQENIAENGGVYKPEQIKK